MKRFQTAVLALCAFFAAGQLFAANKLIVFSKNAKESDRRSAVATLGGELLKDFSALNIALAKFPDGSDSRIAEAVNSGKVSKIQSIENDERRYWLNADLTQQELPSIPSFMETGAGVAVPSVKAANTNKEIPWGVARVNAPAAWADNQGEGVAVAVIDTGIDLKHAELAANIAGGYNAIDPAAQPQDDHGHGTHVAGTIGAVLDGAGVAGVAPKASLYAVKVLGADGSGDTSTIIDAIDWTVKHSIKVINMSLGSSEPSSALAAAVKAAYEAGVTVVCAAGNSGGAVGYPAACPGAIAISASTNKDELAYFSCYGPQIAFTAPGMNIKSAKMGGGLTTMSGTSMASPHVAGLAALAVSAGASSPSGVLSALKKAATPLPGLTVQEQGAGLIDAAKIKGKK